jgi:hypothetical protein
MNTLGAASPDATPRWFCGGCFESVPLADHETRCSKCGATVRAIGRRGIIVDFSAVFREERATARAEERRQRRLAVAAKHTAGSRAAAPAPRPRASRPRRSASSSSPASADDEGDFVEVVGSLLLTSGEALADAYADLLADLIREGRLPPGLTNVGRKC